jgi:hypothetical protein
LEHKGHCQLQPPDVKVSLTELSHGDRELAQTHFNINADVATTQAFLEERTGSQYTPSQLYYL